MGFMFEEKLYNSYQLDYSAVFQPFNMKHIAKENQENSFPTLLTAVIPAV